MNTRLLIKLFFVLGVLFFMVMMGMSNQDPVRFKFKIFDFVSGSIDSAIMYFIFFGVGTLTGGILAAGVGGSGGGGGGKGSKGK